MRALAFVRRGLLVTLFVIKNFVVWTVGWLLLLIAFRPRAVRRRWFATRFRDLLCDLGATYVKVGQIMSTRPDLLPPHIIDALVTLQDDVGAFSQRKVDKIFLMEFQQLPSAIFKHFSNTPVASASVAQVHEATLTDGRRVAVKVRRPNLDTIVDVDLTWMRLFARIISWIPTLGLLAPVETVEEFGRAIRMQLDLRIEAENNRRFRKSFADVSDVDFPELIEELCTRHVLTMTFIEGANVLTASEDQVERTRLAKVGFHTLLKMIFKDGFVHADLHPGNIVVTKDGTVVLLDLGLTADLDDHNRNSFLQFFASWAQRDGKTMARLMVDNAPGDRVPANYDAYEADVLAFTDRYYGKPLGEIEVSRVAFDMMNILRRHRVRVNPTFTMVNIAIAVTEGIGRQLDSELDLLSEALPFFTAVDEKAADK